MAALPSVPTSTVNTEHLIEIVPFVTAASCLLPWIELNMGQPRSSDPPRWTAWLESWYQAIEPSTWPILQKDDAADVQTALAFVACRDKLRREGTSEEDRAEELDVLITTMNRLLDRRCDRCLQIYGLFLLREAFLRHHCALEPHATVEELLSRADRADEERLMCPFPPGSGHGELNYPCGVWPLPIPHPHGDASCPCELHVYDGARNFFRLPDVITSESSRLALLHFGYDPSTEPPEPVAPPPPPHHTLVPCPAETVLMGLVNAPFSWATRAFDYAAKLR